MNNTVNHISDQASTVKFKPAGTDWPNNIVDVQSALAELGGWCQKTTGLPIASQNTLGIISLASLDEANTGTNQTKAITPFTLNQVLKKPEATEAIYGTTKYANAAERVNVSNNVTTITPLGLDYVFNNRPGTESKFGSAKIATKAQAETGNDDNVVMTPLKTKQAIAVHVKPVATATESAMGISKMATIQEIQAGVAREGVAISPYAFANARGTSSSYGTFKSASGADVTVGNAIDMAVTPKALHDAKGSTSAYGIVALSTAVTAGHPNHALAANAAVLPTTGGTMSGALNAGLGIHVGNANPTGGLGANGISIGDHDTGFQWIADGVVGVWSNGVRVGYWNNIGQFAWEGGGGIYDRGHMVYSPHNPPTPESIGAIRNQWGALQMTGDLNCMDCQLDYALPVGHVQVGMWSWHSNGTEDRVWRIYYRYLG
ncbi:MAG: hypothetical protein ACRC9Y_07400 [Aeromonas veronii]